MSFIGIVRGAIAPAVLSLAAGSAGAGTLVAGAASGNLAAEARFEAVGTNLVITLANTSTFDVLVPADVLTGVYFNVTDAPLTLTKIGVLVAAGSTVINVGSQPAGGVVGGEYGYREGLAGPRGTAYGISSSGLGLFGPADVFAGGNLMGPADPDGLQYGITSIGDNIATANGGASTALIKHAVVITLGGLPSGFDPEARIRDVNFQYGTALNEPNLLVPTPGSVSLLAAGTLLAVRRRRR